jgi:hypothetical protein
VPGVLIRRTCEDPDREKPREGRGWDWRECWYHQKQQESAKYFFLHVDGPAKTLTCPMASRTVRLYTSDVLSHPVR